MLTRHHLQTRLYSQMARWFQPLDVSNHSGDKNGAYKRAQQLGLPLPKADLTLATAGSNMATLLRESSQPPGGREIISDPFHFGEGNDSSLLEFLYSPKMGCIAYPHCSANLTIHRFQRLLPPSIA
jgi:hypothetical protein